MEVSNSGQPARLLKAGGAVLLLIVITLGYWRLVLPLGTVPKLFDLESYRDTLDAVAGGALMFDWLGYPPVTLILLSPLRGLPELAGTQLWTGASLFMILGLAAVVSKLAFEARGVSGRTDPLKFLTGFGLAGTMLLLSLPVLNQLIVGQLTLTIVTLAFLDASGAVTRKWQGSLVGLAAAFKLTPLIFFPYYLITRQWRQAGVATASFAAATAVGFALFPRDSLYFWTHADSSGRLGVERIDNLSILGTLTRFMADPAQARMVWYGLALAVGLAAFWRARQHFRRGEQVEAALVIGCASIVISPVAWPHYHVWVVLAALWLLMSGTRRTMIIGLLIYLPYLAPIVMSVSGVVMDFGGSPLGIIQRALLELTVLAATLICVLGLPHRAGSVRGSAAPVEIRSAPLPAPAVEQASA
jgi:alpha-1,2-mannosyltransferase